MGGEELTEAGGEVAWARDEPDAGVGGEELAWTVGEVAWSGGEADADVGCEELVEAGGEVAWTRGDELIVREVRGITLRANLGLTLGEWPI